MKHHLKKSLKRMYGLIQDLITPGTWAWRTFLAFGIGALVVRLVSAPAFGWLDIGLAFAYGGFVFTEVQRVFHKREMAIAVDVLQLYEATTECLLRMYNDLQEKADQILSDLHSPETKRTNTLMH